MYGRFPIRWHDTMEMNGKSFPALSKMKEVEEGNYAHMNIFEIEKRQWKYVAVSKIWPFYKV